MPTTIASSGHQTHVEGLKKNTLIQTTLLRNNNRAHGSVIIVALLVSLAYMTLSLSLDSPFVVSISPETWLQYSAATGKPAFIDPTCQWTKDEPPNEVEWLLMTLKCDVTAMLRIFETLLTKSKGAKSIRNHYDLYFITGMTKTPDAMDIWREYLSFDSFVEHFYVEALFALERKDFCTYPTISRLSQLKNYVLGSRMLSKAFDLITIQYHSACLMKTLQKLPSIPYLVRDVVDIYIDGVDQPMADLNKEASFAGEQIDEFTFNVDEAIARNGHLKDVVELTITLPMNVDPEHGAEEFKQQCKVFFVELEERWQSMEMMSKMLSTEGNGIQMFNNYVLRLLIPTKYADACSQLSSRG